MLGSSQNWWRPGKQCQAPTEPDNLVSLGTVSDQKECTQTSLSCSWFTPVKTQSPGRKKSLPSLPWASTWLEEARALPWTCPDHQQWVRGHSKRGQGYFTWRGQDDCSPSTPRAPESGETRESLSQGAPGSLNTLDTILPLPHRNFFICKRWSVHQILGASHAECFYTHWPLSMLWSPISLCLIGPPPAHSIDFLSDEPINSECPAGEIPQASLGGIPW